jgi:hypothetical protein
VSEATQVPWKWDAVSTAEVQEEGEEVAGEWQEARRRSAAGTETAAA